MARHQETAKGIVRDFKVQCPALDAVTWCTKQISVLEQRFLDIEQELRCELDKHLEFERSLTASLTEMEALREETRTSHVSIMQEQESTQVVADDPIRHALDEVTLQEDLPEVE